MSEYAVEMVLKENLKELRLPTILQEYTASSRAATENGSSYIDFLSGLTTLEVQERAIKRIRRRISEAQFPVIKTLDTWDNFRQTSLLRRGPVPCVPPEYRRAYHNPVPGYILAALPPPD